MWASSGPILFILTAVCALAGPILYRTLFAHSKRNHTRIAADTFFTFERHPILIGMAPTLAERVADGGTLVLSGILAGQEDEVAAAFTTLPRGLEATITADGEWRAITLR